MKLVDGLRRRSGLAPDAAANEPRPDRDGGGDGSSLSVRNECEDETDPAEYCETFSDVRADGLGGANDVVGDIPCDCGGGSGLCWCSNEGVGKSDGATGDQGRKVASGAGGAEREPDGVRPELERAMLCESATGRLLLLQATASSAPAAGGGR